MTIRLTEGGADPNCPGVCSEPKGIHHEDAKARRDLGETLVCVPSRLRGEPALQPMQTDLLEKGEAASRRMRLLRSAAHRMVEHALAEAPFECCGLLAGQGGLIDEVHPTTNHWRQEDRFLVAPREMFEFLRECRRQAREFLGVYHSHPRGPCFPSARDTAEFLEPEISYWIVSLADASPQLGVWRLAGLGLWQALEFDWEEG